jgi:hypothetical protein
LAFGAFVVLAFAACAFAALSAVEAEIAVGVHVKVDEKLNFFQASLVPLGGDATTAAADTCPSKLLV